MLALKHLQHAFLATGFALGLTTVTAAQGTTGVAGVNDFTIAGNFPGSSSCQFQLLPPVVTPFTVNTAPGVGVVLIINFNCPCTPCTFSWPAAPAACGVPLTTCDPLTNQTLDLNPGFASCVFIAVAMPISDAFGNSTLNIPLPSLVRFGAQAAALHPCMPASFPLIFTQAYQISTT